MKHWVGMGVPGGREYGWDVNSVPMGPPREDNAQPSVTRELALLPVVDVAGQVVCPTYQLARLVPDQPGGHYHEPGLRPPIGVHEKPFFRQVGLRGGHHEYVLIIFGRAFRCSDG